MTRGPCKESLDARSMATMRTVQNTLGAKQFNCFAQATNEVAGDSRRGQGPGSFTCIGHESCCQHSIGDIGVTRLYVRQEGAIGF